MKCNTLKILIYVVQQQATIKKIFYLYFTLCNCIILFVINNTRSKIPLT